MDRVRNCSNESRNSELYAVNRDSPALGGIAPTSLLLTLRRRVLVHVYWNALVRVDWDAWLNLNLEVSSWRRRHGMGIARRGRVCFRNISIGSPVVAGCDPRALFFWFLRRGAR